MDAKDILGLPKNSFPSLEKKSRPPKESQRKPDGISREVPISTITCIQNFVYGHCIQFNWILFVGVCAYRWVGPSYACYWSFSIEEKASSSRKGCFFVFSFSFVL